MKQREIRNRMTAIIVFGVISIAAFVLAIGLKSIRERSPYAVPGEKKVLVVDEQSAAGGIKAAYQFEDGSYLVRTASQGFGSEVILDVYISADRHTLRGVELVSQNETPGYGAKIASEPDILAQFEGVELPVYAKGAEGLGLAEKKNGGADQEAQSLADGIYTAEAMNGDYRDVVEIKVEGGIIADVKIESYDKSGNAKSVLAAEGKYVMTETGLTWDKQAEAIAAYVLENQGVSELTVAENGKTDAIAGVSIAISGTVNLIEECLQKAAGTEVQTEIPVVLEGSEVDGISGATVTTRAMIADINKAYTFLNSLDKEQTN